MIQRLVFPLDLSTPPTDGQVPIYDAATRVWRPGTVTTDLSAYATQAYADAAVAAEAVTRAAQDALKLNLTGGTLSGQLVGQANIIALESQLQVDHATAPALALYQAHNYAGSLNWFGNVLRLQSVGTDPISLQPGGTEVLGVAPTLVTAAKRLLVSHLGSAAADDARYGVLVNPASAPLANYRPFGYKRQSDGAVRFAVDINGRVGIGVADPTAASAYSRFTIDDSDATAVHAVLKNSGVGAVSYVLAKSSASWYVNMPSGSNDFAVLNGFSGQNTLRFDIATDRATFAARVITSADFVSDNATKGLILKDAQATPHYWRITISAGALALTDLGTTLPA